MNMKPSPQKRPTSSTDAMRGSTLGQVRYGELQTHVRHPVLRFLVKTTFVVNIGSLVILWALFALKSLFPPHDAAFKWAIGAYFMFGIVYGIFSFFFFKFAKFVEHQMVSRALTHNRRYEWHTHYDTNNITEADLKKVPEAQKRVTASEAVGAGANYFRITGFLALAGIFTGFLGWWSFFGDVL